MKRSSLWIAVLVLAVMASSTAYGQISDQVMRTMRGSSDPQDSAQLLPDPYDPATEPDIDMFINDWHNATPKPMHGNLVEHEIFTPLEGPDAIHPTRKGAILTDVLGLSYATMDGGGATGLTTLTNVQYFLYVDRGTGTITTTDKTEDLYDGIGVIVPPSVTFTITNTGNGPLGMYVVKEPIPEGFEPLKDILTKTSNNIPISFGHWAHLASPIFTSRDGLAVTSNAPVHFDPMTIGQPHSHGLSEEVWFVLDGEATVTIGKQMRKLPAGSAYKIPPNNRNPHSNINPTDQPIKMFWFMTRGNSLVPGAFDNVDTSWAPYISLVNALYDPAVEPHVDMFMQNWHEAVAKASHSTLIERDILTPNDGDPVWPSTRGGVLTSLKRLSHATLYTNFETLPVTLDGEQEVFYTISGRGTVTGGGKTYDIYPGATFLIPEGLEFTMKNTGGEDINFILAVEPAPEDFKPVDHIVWRDENLLSYYTTNAHWVEHDKALLQPSDGLATLDMFETTILLPETFSQPHSHGEGDEDIYISLEGDPQFLMGKQIRNLPAGTGYMVPPTGITPHANYNVTKTPVKLLHIFVAGNAAE